MTNKTSSAFVDYQEPKADAQFLNIVKTEINNLVGIDSTALDGTGSVNNQQANSVKSYVSQAGILCTDTGSQNTYVVNASAPFTNPILKTGTRIRFKTNNANTGASTIAAFGNAASTARKEDGLTALSANDIQTGIYNEFVWDGTYWIKIPSITKATSTTQGILALTPNKTIYLSNNTTDATNDIDVTAGWFNFDDGSGQAYYAGGTGQLDVLFSAGGNGMLDTGTIANTTYHIFLIYNPTTGVSKILASTSINSPTMPSGYTKKVRIGSIIRVSGAILTFRQSDKQFIWTGAKIVDRASTSTVPATSTIQTLTVPLGVAVDAISIVGLHYASGSGSTYIIFREPSELDTVPSISNYDLFAYGNSAGSIEVSDSENLVTRTNTSAQIAIRGTLIAGTHTLGILAKGYIDYQLNY